ncbi:Putative transcriptional regulator [Erwinia sp. Ejp617]|nr:Putative transcriptional regulator [Erwinia sp. Ejp617]
MTHNGITLSTADLHHRTESVPIDRFATIRSVEGCLQELVLHDYSGVVYQFARRNGAGSDRPGRNAEAGGDAFSLRYIGPDESVLTATGM